LRASARRTLRRQARRQTSRDLTLHPLDLPRVRYTDIDPIDIAKTVEHPLSSCDIHDGHVAVEGPRGADVP
jgi:hypothetical protein